MKDINALIPHALKAVEIYLALPAQPGQSVNTVPGEYDGYSASFAASLTIAGLLPTLSFYTDVHKMRNNDAPSKVRRFKLLQALFYIIRPHPENAPRFPENEFLFYVLEKIYENNPSIRNPRAFLPAMEEDEETRMYAIQQDILQASIALKLVLRNFRQTQPAPSSD